MCISILQEAGHSIIRTESSNTRREADRVRKGSPALGKSDIVAFGMSFEADEDVKEKEGHTPHLLTVNNHSRTAAKGLVIAGASIIVLHGPGSNFLQVAASSQNWFKARIQFIHHYGDSLAMKWRSGVHQLPIHIADHPRQTIPEHIRHWTDNTADPLISPPQSPSPCSSPKGFGAPIYRSAAG